MASYALSVCGCNNTSFAGNVMDTRPLSKRTRSLWADTAARGHKLYDEWKDKSGSDEPPPAPMDQNFESELWTDQSTGLGGFITSLGRNEYATDIYNVQLMWPFFPDATSAEGPDDMSDCALDYKAEFISVVSPSQALYMAEDNRRTSTEGPLPSKWTYSHLAWYMWTKAVQKRYPDDYHAHYGDLQLYVRTRIRDSVTRGLIFQAMDARGARPGSELRFNECDQTYWVLMGSPIGQELMEMMTQNKVALHSKDVFFFGVHWEPQRSKFSERIIHMWAELGVKKIPANQGNCH